jgi:hypothetical protein
MPLDHPHQRRILRSRRPTSASRRSRPLRPRAAADYQGRELHNVRVGRPDLHCLGGGNTVNGKQTAVAIPRLAAKLYKPQLECSATLFLLTFDPYPSQTE